MCNTRQDKKKHSYFTRSKNVNKRFKHANSDYVEFDNSNSSSDSEYNSDSGSDSEWLPNDFDSEPENDDSDDYDSQEDDNESNDKNNNNCKCKKMCECDCVYDKDCNCQCNCLDENQEFDINKYRNMLHNLFPSNYSSQQKENFNIILSINPHELLDLDNINENNKQLDKNNNKNNNKNNKTANENANKFNNLLKLNINNPSNDIKHFKDNLDDKTQNYVIQELTSINNYYNNITTPYKIQLLESKDIPKDLKAIAFRKITTFQNMDPHSGEYYKLKNWVDAFMRIPFGKYNSLPVTLDKDGIDTCSEFMNNSLKVLDEAVYGMADVKMQIMQMLGQWISNPDAIGTSIAIKGPMGTGKTTLVKDGISKILGREFAFIALGGATDSSFLEGHSYTYEGSLWGKIVDILIQTKTMNPVIYFDELDKISDTAKGEEIIGILTHLTDNSQNNKFYDKYFADLHFDLSKAIFIFSYNYEDKINLILKDRMFCVETSGYNTKEKTIISTDYLIPKIIKQVNIKKEDIIFNEETIKYIIDNYTNNEKGVRNLKRCFELIYTKCNLYRFIKPETELLKKEMNINVTFPINVDIKLIDSILKKRGEKRSWQNIYM